MVVACEMREKKATTVGRHGFALQWPNRPIKSAIWWQPGGAASGVAWAGANRCYPIWIGSSDLDPVGRRRWFLHDATEMALLLGYDHRFPRCVRDTGSSTVFWRRQRGGAVRVPATVAVVKLGPTWLVVCGLFFPQIVAWAWAPLGLAWASYVFSDFTFIYCSFLFWSRLWREISVYTCCVGLLGPCASVCTQCAVVALGWQRVIGVVKWSLPPSGKMKLSVVGFIIWRQHSRKAVLKLAIMLRCNRVTYRVIFPLCHCYFKANGAASSALFASWCLFEYKYCVEIPDIISGHTLVAYCNQGLGSMSLPCIQQFH